MYEKSNDLINSAIGLIQNEKNIVANLANISALIYDCMENLNWAGFYLWDEADQELVLGPFQGKPACIRIKSNRGVCGKAYSTQKTQLVHDVHEFADHIACDANTNSELVIPLIKNNICLGVLDLDSPLKGRFTEKDQKILEDLGQKIVPLIWK